jgi:glycosyltransferase involved in cell wall biosynthesis
VSREAGATRVLLLASGMFAKGGIQRFNQTLAGALSKVRVRVDVLALQDTPAEIAAHHSWDGVQISGFSGNRLRFSVEVLRRLLLQRQDWLAIGHINFLLLAVLSGWLRPIGAPRRLLITHGIEVWSGLGALRAWGLRRLDTILCVSAYTRRRILEQAGGLDPDRLQIFPNALGESWEGCTEAAVATDGARPFILSVTRLERGDRYKGVLTTIEALSMLRDTDLDYLVVGHGDDQPFLEAVARRLGVQDRVKFLRGISDEQLVSLYGRCRAFVLPSGKEGFGIVFLEAMYFGAPVIGAAEKGALDVIQHGENGLLVRYGDVIRLKETIQRLSADEGLRQYLRSRGRKVVTGDGPFTFRRFMQRTGAVFATPPRATG